MDKLSIFIGESVDTVDNKYQKRILRTKRLYIRALNNEIPKEQFNEEVAKIWDGIDHSFMEQRIEELKRMVDKSNLQDKDIVNTNAEEKQVYEIAGEDKFIYEEDKFKRQVQNMYESSSKTLENEFIDKEIYLSKQVSNFHKNIATKPYYNKNGTIKCYVDIAQYNSMLFNTNLNKSGWNRTLYDAELMENDLVYLPAHPFACPLCMEWQGKVYSISGKSKKYPPQEEAIEGGIGHPNCKHQWLLYYDKSQIQNEDYDSIEWEEKYRTLQKERSLELQRTRLKVDKSLYEEIGDFGMADKMSAKIKALNSKIKELKSYI